MKRILVGIKRVVDYNVRIRVKPDGSGVVTDGVKMSINPFDEIALEEALRIKERGGAEEVVVATVGPADCQQQLRTALAMGADRALHVAGRRRRRAAGGGAGAAEARSSASSRCSCILGKQAIDDDNGQTGQMLAALWNRPQATYASKLELTDEQRARHARSGRRPRDPRGRPAGRHHHRPAPERAALREAAGHHEGQEEAARYARPWPRSGVEPRQQLKLVQLRAAAAAPEGRHGQGRRRAGRGAEEEGTPVSSKILIVAEHDGAQAQSQHRQVRHAARARLPARRSRSLVCAVDGGAVAAQAAQLAGVARVLMVENPANAHAAGRRAGAADRRARRALHARARSLDHLRQGPDAARGGVCSTCAAGQRHHGGRESRPASGGPIYAGNAILTVEVAADAKVVGTVRTASFEAAGSGGSAPHREGQRVDVDAADAHALRLGVGRQERPPGPADRARASSPAAARWAAPRTSRSSTASPTSSAPPWAPHAPRWTPATRPTRCRSGRPARSSRRSCTWRSASPVPSST